MRLLIYLTISIMCSIWFTSCRSVQYVPVETVRTEIQYKERADSIVIKEKVNVRDSVRMRDSTVTIVNDKGDVIRIEVWHWKEKYSDVNTLYDSLKSRYDSLYSAKTDSVQVPYPVEKQLSRWQSAKMELGGWAFGVIIAFALVFVGWLVVRIRRK